MGIRILYKLINIYGFFEILLLTQIIENPDILYKYLCQHKDKYNLLVYKMFRQFVRDNITMTSIVLFVILFGVIQVMKPTFLYNSDGSIRDFGVGYKNKTILPIWLLSIILGILCYVFVMYYIAYPRFF